MRFSRCTYQRLHQTRPSLKVCYFDFINEPQLLQQKEKLPRGEFRKACCLQTLASTKR